MKKKLFTFLFLAAYSLCSFGQVNVTSPAATEFVRYERIPVGYFNGLPSIDIPLYTLDYKDLHLPIHLSYHASGIKVNQYPTCVGLGWNLNAGGCITRVVNEIPDETCAQDFFDQTGVSTNANTGYYFSSGNFDNAGWASEEKLSGSIIVSNRTVPEYDFEPDEFVINAYGVSGSVYFYRDKYGNIKSQIRSNNGELFSVEPPVIVRNPTDITFKGGKFKDLHAYRVYELFYEFTVIKNDGTKLVFGGDYDSIEFYTEKKVNSGLTSSQNQYMKTWPTAWMLKEVISPNGNKISFEYQRDGSPIMISDVISDVSIYHKNGEAFNIPDKETDRGVSFIVQHPVYPKSISVDNGYSIVFTMNESTGLSTTNSYYDTWMQYDGLSDQIIDNVCYDSQSSSIKLPYQPHNYSQKLVQMTVYDKIRIMYSFIFSYTENPDERLKLKDVAITGSLGDVEQKYTFGYNKSKLPSYNSAVTDNWGYFNNKNYRTISIDKTFFEFRSPNEYYTKSEILTDIQYPTGGKLSLDYELNDYSKVATQAPDFKILDRTGKAGGLRIKKLTYSTDTTSYSHSFEYKNEDGTSSGILSGIPVYVAQGSNYYSYNYSTWLGQVYFHDKADVAQNYKMVSESYINALGLTSGNHVTYSRVTEYVGDENPLVKEYRYTNHDSCPDTEDFAMFTNIDNVGLDNKFTSHALMRGLLTDEIWYNDGKKVKTVHNTYNSNPDRFDKYVKCIDKFKLQGLQAYLFNVPFVRLAPYKILTFYPYLESRTETLYNPDGQTIMSSITESFTYNDNLLPEKITKNLSDGTIETSTISYPDKYKLANVYKDMLERGIVSSPVEKVTYRDGKVVEGRLIEYKEENSIFTPHLTWRLDLDENQDSIGFHTFTAYSKDNRYVLDNEIVKIDAHGNPLLVRTESGMPVSYQWNSFSAYPTAIVSNASNTYINRTTWESKMVSQNIDLYHADLLQNTGVHKFVTHVAGDVVLNLAGALGCDWQVTGNLDGKAFDLIQIRSRLPLDDMWSRYAEAYTSTITFPNIPEGTHRLEITSTKVRKGTESYYENGNLGLSYDEGKGNTEISGCDEFFYEDFESRKGTQIQPFGYHSDRCCVGEYDIRMYGDSEKAYILDYMVYRKGKWEYVRMSIGRTYTINEGLNPIDNVRVWPDDASIETYSWFPIWGLRCRTDGRGVSESYGYDSFGRLHFVRDNNNDVIKQYHYNYAYSLPHEYPVIYGNEQMSMGFNCSRCDTGDGEFYDQVMYTVPSFKYSSYESQSDANRMAFEEILANGQEYADLHGKCIPQIKLSIYNPTSKTCSIEFFWGTQGNIQSASFDISPGYSSYDDDPANATIIFIPRRNYRGVSIKDENQNLMLFESESGYTSNFFYDKSFYSGNSDIYTIQKQ